MNQIISISLVFIGLIVSTSFYMLGVYVNIEKYISYILGGLWIINLIVVIWSIQCRDDELGIKLLIIAVTLGGLNLMTMFLSKDIAGLDGCSNLIRTNVSISLSEQQISDKAAFLMTYEESVLSLRLKKHIVLMEAA